LSKTLISRTASTSASCRIDPGAAATGFFFHCSIRGRQITRDFASFDGTIFALAFVARRRLWLRQRFSNRFLVTARAAPGR
jgi:hypothetical protein